MSTGILQVRVKDYPARVNDLTDFMETQYGVESTCSRIIAASLLPVHGSNPAWIVCDSPKHVFWEHMTYALGRINSKPPYPLPWMTYLRGTRPRYANDLVEDLLTHREESKILLDWRYDEPSGHLHPRNRYPEIASECVRLYVRPASLRVPGVNAKDELTRLLKLAIDAEHRDELPVAMRPNATIELAAGLLMRLNPELTNGSTLLTNLCMIPSTHAALHGRNRLEDCDREALQRVIQDSVRPWTRKILTAFIEHPGAMDLSMLAIHTLLPKAVLINECSRLAAQDVLDWPPPNGSGARKRWISWGKGKGISQDVEGLMQGVWNLW